MSHILIVMLSLYMVYTNIKMLAGVPFSAWNLEQYLLAAVTLGFIIVAGYFARIIYKKNKPPKDED